jgi:hypothetical protein
VSYSMTVKRGDLLPPFVVDLTNGTDPNTGAGIPVDLSTATAIKVVAWRDNVLLFSRPVTVPTGDDATGGTVTMPWQATDTDEWADLYVEVEVMFPSSKPQTFPADGYFVVHVEPDLG